MSFTSIRHSMKSKTKIWLPVRLLAITLSAFARRPMPTVSDADVAHLRQSIPASATAKPAQPCRVLIYNFTRGTYHDEAIAWATRVLELMGGKDRRVHPHGEF